MTYLHHVDIGAGEGELLLKGDLFGILHGVTERGSQLPEVVVGVAVVGTDEAVKGVEGVEKEVRADLLLQGLVAGEDILGLEVLVFKHQLLLARHIVEK